MLRRRFDQVSRHQCLPPSDIPAAKSSSSTEKQLSAVAHKIGGLSVDLLGENRAEGRRGANAAGHPENAKPPLNGCLAFRQRLTSTGKCETTARRLSW
ncbi:hypothetical protein FRC02_011032 [Tulasnella sp. 418]|nr:hypothetical protein FRC02_011032 [Tulasnella sp. 418]